MTEVLVHNPEDHFRYKGRGTEPLWKQVKVADDRSSPVKGIHVPADMGKAERACECLRIVVAKLRCSKEDLLARQSLFLWLHSSHDTIEALASVVGAEAFHRLVSQLQDLWHWASGRGPEWPRFLDQRLEALAKAVDTKRKSKQVEDDEKSLDSLFASNSKLAHRLTNRPNTEYEVGQAKNLGLADEDHLQDVEQKFKDLWRADEPEAHKEFAEAFVELRTQLSMARAKGLSPSLQQLEALFDVPQVRRALSQFKSSTSTGVCQVALRDLRSAPDEVLRSLGHMLARVAWLGVGPSECHWQLLDLIPKKPGGFRSVATMCSLWRIAAALLAPCLREWDASTALEGDTAKAGQSSLDRMFYLSLRDATNRALGKHTGILLWDQAAFYETIKPVQLVEAHSKMNMPLLPLTMSVWSHGAPRLFRFKSALGRQAVVPGASVLTGCTTSTSIARAVIQPAVSAADRIGGSTSSVHVDDVAQEACGTEDEVRSQLVEAGTIFVEIMLRQGQTMSSKSVVVSTSRQVSTAVVKYFLQNFGLKLNAAKSSDHLGVLRTNGYTTSFSTVRKRFGRAKKRNARVKWLVKKDRRASKLFSSGVAPQACYGTASTGLSLALQKQLDSMCLCSLGYQGYQPCRTSAVFGRLGYLPSVETLLKTTRSFINAWKTLSESERAETTRAWRALWPSIKTLPSTNWKAARCTLTAVMMVLQQAGWTSELPHVWHNRDMSAYGVISTSDGLINEDILEALRKDLYAIHWHTAASHHGGQGLESGEPDFSAVHQVIKLLRKHEQHRAADCAWYVAVGGSSVGNRKSTDNACPACGAPDSVLHRWSCRELLKTADEFIQKWLRKTSWVLGPERISRFLMGAAGTNHEPQVLCFRGLIPFALPKALTANVKQFELQLGNTNTTARATFTDGSKPTDRRIPQHASRCGAAAVAFNFTDDLDPEMLAAEISKSCEVRLSTVKGKQTVPRAELTATISATQHHPKAPSFTDAAYVAEDCAREPPPNTFYNVSPQC